MRLRGKKNIQIVTEDVDAITLFIIDLKRSNPKIRHISDEVLREHIGQELKRSQENNE